MNKNQRIKNRETYRWLQYQNTPDCPECGAPKARHWISHPFTLADMLAGKPPSGFWTCPKFYGPDGRRLEHDSYIGGPCARTACSNTNAMWFNHSTRRMYCEECARKINLANHEEAKLLYGHALCVKVEQPQE